MLLWVVKALKELDSATTWVSDATNEGTHISSDFSPSDSGSCAVTISRLNRTGGQAPIAPYWPRSAGPARASRAITAAQP